MVAQNAGWSWNFAAFDSNKALQHRDQVNVTFAQGKTALKFFSNRLKTLPYLRNDPRMCTTLPTWLKLLEGGRAGGGFHVSASARGGNVVEAS
jgi:hypothetical protein